MSSPKKSFQKKRMSSAASPAKKIMQSVSNSIQASYMEELNQKMIEGQDKDIEIERLQTTCVTLNNKVSVTNDLHHEISVLKTRLTESEQIRKHQQEEIENYELNRQEYERTRLQQESVIANYERTRLEYERTRLQQENVIADYERTRLQQKKENKALQSENETLRRDLAEVLFQKQKLQQELEQATDYIIKMEEKVYKSNKISLELLKQLKDAETEISTLQQYIIDLKQRIAVYIPIKNDQTDRKLAEFINNYPERSKLKIMFMRESEGVYVFGSKRVAVKVEKDNIKIRVGGGFLSIDEFLDQYTPVELEKLERKDPLKRFSEKVAIQKTIINAEGREQSPVRGRGGSPNRQSSPGRKQAV